MASVLHGSARTTPRIRAELQASEESSRALAAAYGLNPKTVAKWRGRAETGGPSRRVEIGCLGLPRFRGRSVDLFGLLDQSGGLVMLILFAGHGLLGTFPGLVVAHLVVTLPYALRVLSTSVAGLPIIVEEAAGMLGASPLIVFRRITLPMMVPGIVATCALCFLVSFDEAVTSLFLTGPRITTLPVAMYHHVDTSADPLVAAVSVLLIVMTLIITLVVDRSVGLAKAFVK